MRLFLFLAATLSVLAEQSAMIDACRYADDGEAQAAWKPMRGTAPVRVARMEGRAVLRLPCNLSAGDIERASWDRAVNLDLSAYQGIEFRLWVKEVAPVGHFAIYFQSGDGWYTASFFPKAVGRWSTVTVEKAGMRVEGRPAGWGSIRTIRISAWRGRGGDTEFYLSDLRGFGVLGQDASVAILRADSAGANASGRAAGQFASTVAGHLSALGVRHATLSDMDVTAARLAGAKVLILPNNGTMPERAAAELAQYLNNGGKLLAFYMLPARLRTAAGMEGGAHVQTQMSAIRFAPGALEGAPAQAAQRSWNVAEGKPVEGASRVLAEWLDSQGQSTGRAAVLASSNCIWMTHVMLRDDPVNKRRMLMAMLGRLSPEVLRQGVEAAITDFGRGGPLERFRDSRASRSREEARRLLARGRYLQAAEKITSAREELVTAFARAQKPQRGEFRAFWCHNAAGIEGMEWDEAVRRLAENGFNAVVPNMLWGGVGYYDSQVLPVAPEVATRGDQIAKCLAACRKHGIQMHVWKVNWNLSSRAPAAFVEKMRGEGRLQMSSRGKEENWLCPSHPENQKLEIASMVEVARRYEVDGVHFDYIRYPDGDHCFCPGCRERFARASGVKIDNWPRDVMNGGPHRRKWLDWRRDNITTVVKAVSEQARKARPRIKISAAVFRNWATDRDGVGQDWKLWCERGYLDFVCPMDYTENDGQFDVWVRSQKEWAGPVPVYPGIGASSSSSSMGPEGVIAQIQIARRYKTNGFIIFNYGEREARSLLPMLGLGITKR